MSDIFISYANEDRERIAPLARALEAAGWSVWWDSHIRAGKHFDVEIEKALGEARCVVAVWTKNSVASAWVRAEAADGAEREILVPVMLEEARIPLAFRHIQAARLLDWQGSPTHAGFARLVEDISEIIGPPPRHQTARPASAPASPPPKPAATTPEAPPTPGVTAPPVRAKLYKIISLIPFAISVGFPVVLAVAGIIWVFYAGWREEGGNRNRLVNANDSGGIQGTVATPKATSVTPTPPGPAVSPSPPAGPRVGDSSEVTIATWNVRGGMPGITAERAKELARAISAFDPALVVLTEVAPDDAAGRIAEALRAGGRPYNHTILPQDSAVRQNIALLYKTGVEVSDAQLVAGSDGSERGQRRALAARVKIGAFDFVLVGVHLRSKRSDDLARGRMLRDVQASAIAAYVGEATAGAEKDVLVLGDYNMVKGEDDGNFQTLGRDSLRFLSTELPAGQFTFIGSGSFGNVVIDHFAISRKHTAEYVPETARAFPLHEALGLSLPSYRESISDHLPLLARFRTRLDDD